MVEYVLLFPAAVVEVAETGSAAECISPYALAPVADVEGAEVLLEPARDGNDDKEPEGALVGKEFLGGNALVFVAFVDVALAAAFAGIVFKAFAVE